MAHIRAMHDPIGETLTVYWAEPNSNQVCEETGNGVILIKDGRTGDVIGFERRYYRPNPGGAAITFETSSAMSS